MSNVHLLETTHPSQSLKTRPSQLSKKFHASELTISKPHVSKVTYKVGPSNDDILFHHSEEKSKQIAALNRGKALQTQIDEVIGLMRTNVERVVNGSQNIAESSHTYTDGKSNEYAKQIEEENLIGRSSDVVDKGRKGKTSCCKICVIAFLIIVLFILVIFGLFMYFNQSGIGVVVRKNETNITYETNITNIVNRTHVVSFDNDEDEDNRNGRNSSGGGGGSTTDFKRRKYMNAGRNVLQTQILKTKESSAPKSPLSTKNKKP